METYSLFELNEHIRRVIALNFEDHLWVKCEIAQARMSRGHYYLELIEKDATDNSVKAQSSAVIWSRQLSFIKKKFGKDGLDMLRDGVEIRVRVRVDFHERYGLKLQIEDIDPAFTLGNLELQRRETLLKLKEAGLLERNAALPIPIVVQRIAILSSGQAAGYHDFIEHLTENVYGYVFETDLFTVALQGNRVEQEVVKVLAQIQKLSNDYDCVVIIRGGGSRIDLAAFDSFALGAAIANCPIPVFTGIGHEIDQSVADIVSHTELKTPTAVADFLVEINLQFDSTVSQIYSDILAGSRSALHTASIHLNNLVQQLRTAPSRKVMEESIKLGQIMPQIAQTLRSQLITMHGKLEHASALVMALEPSKVLQRGFSMTFLNGKLVTDQSGVVEGATIETHLAKGSIKSKVIK